MKFLKMKIHIYRVFNTLLKDIVLEISSAVSLVSFLMMVLIGHSMIQMMRRNQVLLVRWSESEFTVNCEFCGTQFKEGANLKEHQKRIH